MNNLDFSAFRAAELPAIERFIDDAFAKSPAHRVSRAPSLLHEMIRYHFQTGGKRLRAIAVLWAAHGSAIARGGNPREAVAKALPFAAAVEILHNATLVHDDLQDGDELRRGEPTLWKKYSSAQAINCGDMLFFEAVRVVLGADYNDALARELITLLEEKTIAVVEGQGLEFALKEKLQRGEGLPTLAEYEAMVGGKTAALFSLPLVGGARIAGVSVKETNSLALGAAELGFAFQVHDDYIDLWGQKGRAQPGSDIAEGKLSYPVLKGIELLRAKSDSTSADKLAEIVALPRERTREAEVRWAIQTLETCGAKSATEEKLRELRIRTALPGWEKLLLPLFDSFV